MASTDIEVRQQHALGLPSDNELETVWRMAQRLCNTEFVPRGLRGSAEKTMACVLYGREIGIGPMQSLQSIQVIEGKPTQAPELMRSLIRREGHTLDIESEKTFCRIHGKRADTGEEATTSFDLDDAVQAGLCQIKDGKPFARSKEGKKLPWETYTRDMLLARATGRIGRLLFSDVIMGVSYTPEEMLSVGTDVVDVADEEDQGGGETSRPPETAQEATQPPAKTTRTRKPPERRARPPAEDQAPAPAQAAPEDEGIEDAEIVDETLPGPNCIQCGQPVLGHGFDHEPVQEGNEVVASADAASIAEEVAALDIRDLTAELEKHGLSVAGTTAAKRHRLIECLLGVAPAQLDPNRIRQDQMITLQGSFKGYARADRIDAVNDILPEGRTIESFTELTESEADELIRVMK